MIGATWHISLVTKHFTNPRWIVFVYLSSRCDCPLVASAFPIPKSIFFFFTSHLKSLYRKPKSCMVSSLAVSYMQQTETNGFQLEVFLLNFVLRKPTNIWNIIWDCNIPKNNFSSERENPGFKRAAMFFFKITEDLSIWWGHNLLKRTDILEPCCKILEPRTHFQTKITCASCCPLSRFHLGAFVHSNISSIKPNYASSLLPQISWQSIM